MGVDPRGEQRECHVTTTNAQLRRIVGDGDRVVVHDADDGRHLVLQTRPVLDGTQIIADVQLARRLDSTENS